MTKAEVKKVLRANRERNIRPWCFNQLALMYGCNRSFVTMYFSRKHRRKSHRFGQWLAQTLGNGTLPG